MLSGLSLEAVLSSDDGAGLGAGMFSESGFSGLCWRAGVGTMSVSGMRGGMDVSPRPVDIEEPVLVSSSREALECVV